MKGPAAAFPAFNNIERDYKLMSAFGPSRRFAATQHFGRFWGEADINRQTKPAGSVANDPEPTSALGQTR
jgi:hypothetical protein